MKKKLSLLIVLVLFLAGTFSFAEKGRGMGDCTGPQRMERGDWIKETLDLSDKQFEKLDDLREERREEVAKLHLKIEKIRLEMKEILLEDDVDYGKLKDLIDDIGDIRTEIQKGRIDHLEDVEKILNDDQFKKFKLHFMRRKGGRRGFHGNRKSMKGHRPRR